MTPNQILNAIEQKTLVLINLPHGNYYISQDARIFSLNQAHPKEIRPVLTSSGEYCVTLYVPALKNYKLSELMLLTFSRQPEKGEVPCYKNANPADCSIENLYWGGQTESKKWRASLAVTQSKEVVQRFENVEHSLSDVTVSYYCNKAFLTDMNHFTTQISLTLLNHEVVAEDVIVLKRLLSQLTEATSVNTLNIQRLAKIVEVDVVNSDLARVIGDFRYVLSNNRTAYHTF